MSRTARCMYAVHAVLLLAAMIAVGVCLWSMVSGDPNARKLEHVSDTRYLALAWSAEGLQFQLARHDPTTELNAWLSSLDVRNKTSGLSVDTAGFRAWNYHTNGLDVAIYQAPVWCFWAVIFLMLAGLVYYRQKSSRHAAHANPSTLTHKARLT